MDSSVPLTHPYPSDLRLIYLIKKRKIRFRIFSDEIIQSWIFLKKRTPIFSVQSGAKKTGRAKVGRTKAVVWAKCEKKGTSDKGPDYMANFSPVSGTNSQEIKLAITWRMTQPGPQFSPG